jgi:hypothetical protein
MVRYFPPAYAEWHSAGSLCRQNGRNDQGTHNLTHRFLRRLDARVDQVIETQREHSLRLTALETGIGDLEATEMSHCAITAGPADRMGEQLDRIERRLDLADPAG